MSKVRHICIGVLTAIIAVLSFAVHPGAEEAGQSKPDPGRTATLTVLFTQDRDRVDGMEFRAYKVFDLDENGNHSYAKAYTKYSLSLPDSADEYRDLAQTLAGYIERDAIKPEYSGKTDKGSLKYGEVEKGIYLILSDPFSFEGTTYTASPGMVQVPKPEQGTGGNQYTYDVTCVPKYTYKTTPKTETPGNYQINVRKVWQKSKGTAAIPESIEVELICEGNVLETVELNENNNWRHTFNGLKQELSDKYKVTEKTVPEGWTVTSSREGNLFILRNTEDVPKTPDDSDGSTAKSGGGSSSGGGKLPQTGQNWMIVWALFGAGIVLLCAGLIRRKSR